MLIYNTCEINGCKERANKADNPGCSKTANRTSTCYQQNNTRDERGQVGVEDGTECVGIAFGESLFDTLSCTHFFLNTLIYQHVCIDRSTKSKDDTGNTRHGKSRLETGQNTQREEEVEQQCPVGHHTRYEVVHNHHVNHQENKGNYKRPKTLLNGLGTQCRTNNCFLNNASGSRHTSRLQSVGQVFGIFNGEVARDGRLTTINFLVNARSRIDNTIQNDSYCLAYISLGELSPFTSTIAIHGHTNLRTAKIVKLVFCISYHITLNRSASVTGCNL